MKSSDDVFADELESKNERLYLILRGHLYIENELNKLLENFLPNPSVLELYREGFRRKLDLALALNLIEQDHFDIICAFNEIRNKYAHRLKYRISHQEITDLKNNMSKIEGYEELAETITIGDKSSSTIDLKVVIIALRSIFSERAIGVSKCENPTYNFEEM